MEELINSLERAFIHYQVTAITRTLEKLGALDDPRAINQLLEYCGSADDDFGRAASVALYDIGARLLPTLINRTKSENISRREMGVLEGIVLARAGECENGDLRTLASMETVNVFWKWFRWDPGEDPTGGCVPEFYDCSRIRQVAQQELARRGLEF